VDQLGNVAGGELFNHTLIELTSSDKFGKEDETISSVLGKNKVANKLTWLGKKLDYILDRLDPGHSIKHIEADE
jgi:hypothetical protein